VLASGVLASGVLVSAAALASAASADAASLPSVASGVWFASSFAASSPEASDGALPSALASRRPAASRPLSAASKSAESRDSASTVVASGSGDASLAMDASPIDEASSLVTLSVPLQPARNRPAATTTCLRLRPLCAGRLAPREGTSRFTAVGCAKENEASIQGAATCQLHEWRAKQAQSPYDTLGILYAGVDPDVKVLGGPRPTVNAEGIGAHHHEADAIRAQRGTLDAGSALSRHPLGKSGRNPCSNRRACAVDGQLCRQDGMCHEKFPTNADRSSRNRESGCLAGC
jgi:hypothetical protein